jgi:hypothetical protein
VARTREGHARHSVEAMPNAPPHRAVRAGMAAMEVVAGLKPTHVVASHKDRDLADDPKTIQETRRYLEDVERVLAGSRDAREF